MPDSILLLLARAPGLSPGKLLDLVTSLVMKAPSGFYWKRKKREAFPLTKLYPFENIVHNFSKWELAQERIILDSKYSYDTYNLLMNKLLEIHDFPKIIGS